jgi:peptidoglycan/xylan/chitin deacetylase (PgdA/CDA1 family)
MILNRRWRAGACLACIVAFIDCQAATKSGFENDDDPNGEDEDASADGSHPNRDGGVKPNDSGTKPDAKTPDGGIDSGFHFPPCTNPGHENPGATPQTDFNPQPSYIPNDTLILTLDDGADSTNTPAILDILKQRNIKADFFVNTENWGGPVSVLKRMVDEGHAVGNHTVHHHHLAPGGGPDGQHLSTPAEVEAEITGVDSLFAQITSGAISQLTRFRAPFGEPYQSGSASDKSLVLPVVAKHAVEISWNFDTFDTNTTDPNVVYDNFVRAVKTPGAAGASWGIFLMHSVNPQDVGALPKILDYIASRNFKLARVEDVLCWKFGKHSWEIAPKLGKPAP